MKITRAKFCDVIYPSVKVIEGWFTFDESLLLFKTMYGKENVIELGSYKGRSANVLGQADIKKIYCVDPCLFTEWQRKLNEKYVEEYQDVPDVDLSESVYADLQKNTAKFSNIEILRCKSEDAVGRFGDGYFDGVFVDAIHTYESVVKDATMWFPKLKVGGHMAFHDYYANRWPGVVKACNEFVTKQLKMEVTDKKDTLLVFKKYGD